MMTMPERTRVKGHDMSAAWRHVDVTLCVLVGLTTAFGSVMIYSATHHGEDPNSFISKHAIYVALGVLAMALTAAVDYQKLRDWSRVVYAASVAALVLVLVPGVGAVHKNIRAWFDIGPFQIQPAEFAKVALIVSLASTLGVVTERGKRIRFRDLLLGLVMVALPVALILQQPDLGTALVFLVVGVGLFVVGGVPTRYLVALMVVGVAGVIGILNSGQLDQYQKDRLTAFVSPDSASEKIIYNTRQAQTAIASGSVTGKGLFEGPQTKGGFVPEQQTDFIFTVAGEELGFVGSSVLILLLGGIAYRVWRTAHLARDETGRLMCVGVLCLLVFHVFENIGMNLGIMPVTGIPLPFVSYGGSSTITTFAAMGLVMNVHMRRFN